MTKPSHLKQAQHSTASQGGIRPYRPRPLAMAVVAGTATLLAACNPGGDVSLGRAALDIQATAPSYSANTARSLTVRDAGEPVVLPVINPDSSKAGDLTLTKAWIVVRSIELEREDDDEDDDDQNDDDDEIEFVGPFVVNLLTNEVTPNLPELSLPRGRYDDIEIEYGPLRSNDRGVDGQPLMDQFADLGSDYSLYLEGQYTPVNGAVDEYDFKLTYDEDDDFELSGLDASLGFDVDGPVDLIVAFRMARWFRFDDDDTNDDNVNLENAITFDSELDRNVIFLDDDESLNDAQKVFDVIEENIEESADYGEDDDDDGELGSDEDDDDDNSGDDDWDDWDDDDDN